MAAKAWQGVFETTTDKRVEQFTESISFDHRLYRQDIAGSLAHAQMLTKQGLLTEEEYAQIETNLKEIEKEIEAGTFPYQIELEDIHMHIERALIERIGDTGRKLHTARSRNDQVATDFRLWVRDAIDDLSGQLRQLQKAYVGRCERDKDTVIPGYTHLQRAQPVLAPHYWLAYCEKWERDWSRLMDCRRRVNVCSLGSAALAGSSLPIDREMTAQLLGFEEVARNSLDVASDRDFVLEFGFCLSVIALHLSTWAEEWILWSTTEFDFIDLPETFCTGSSIMPQKINPDVLELIRGKTARVIGNLQALMVLVKGLPLAYNRDLQEDKPRIFDAYDTVHDCLALAIPMVEQAELRRESIASRLEHGYLDATTLMEYFIQRGIPQRKGHELVGKLVRQATRKKVPLAELELEAFQEIEPSLTEEVYEVLGVQKAIERFVSYGSTSPAQVAKQVAFWQEKLAQES
ncbi:Argininosuccinate lyase [Planctomycetales bacterium 10988]|nr:Argininosuccinate lyase [Planctomycetales bacterium 10988]